MANLFRKYGEIFLSLGTSSNYSGAENGKIKVMNFGCILASFGCLVSYFFRIANPPTDLIALYRPLVAIIIILSLYIFNYYKKHRIGWHLGLTFFLLIITFSGLSRPVFYANYMIFGAIIFLVAFLFSENRRTQYFYLLFISINLIAFTWLSSIGMEQGFTYPIAASMGIVLIALFAQYLLLSLSFRQFAQKEKELATAISLKEAALDANKDATIIINNKEQITDWNTHYLEMWNLTEEDMLNSTPKKIVERRIGEVINWDSVFEAFKSIRNNPGACSFDRIYLKSGKIIENHSQPQILNGKVVGRVYNFRDVTLKMQDKKRIAKSESRFRSFYEDSPIGIIIFENPNVPFKNVNQRFCKMFGYTQSEIAKLQIKDVCANDYIETHIEEYSKLIKSGAENFSLLNKYKKKSGEQFWGNINVSLRRNEQDKIQSIIIMLEDVNEKILQEQKIKNLLTELTQLNKIWNNLPISLHMICKNHLEWLGILSNC